MDRLDCTAFARAARATCEVLGSDSGVTASSSQDLIGELKNVLHAYAQLRHSQRAGHPTDGDRSGDSFTIFDTALGSFAAQLDVAANALHMALLGCYKHINEQARPTTVQEVVSYAHRIRWTTFAPIDWQPQSGVQPPPPAPQSWHMQSSLLYNWRSLHPQAQPRESTRAAAEVKVKPPELPPIPEGWRPGDPIPGLPQLLQLPDQKGSASHPGQEAIVQDSRPGQLVDAKIGDFGLILNPDLEVADDDSESDYSDDDY